MKIVAIIPARYNSKRYPGKLMKQLDGESIIATTYRKAVSMGLFDEVWVATDSDSINQEIKNLQGNVIITGIHSCGTDRIAEANLTIKGDIIINIQGDEPFIDKENIEPILKVFLKEENVETISLMAPITREEDVKNINCVKVIVDNYDYAIYFSRSTIPYSTDNPIMSYYKHIGIYGFRKKALNNFFQLKRSTLESAESLEQLRLISEGKKIKMIISNYNGISIDTKEDLIIARNMLNDNKNLLI